MKSRFVFSIFCMLVAMTMATSAFAQATYQVSSGATQGRMNGHTEMTGGITLSPTSGTIASPDTGTVVIDYGLPITNAVNKGPITEEVTTDIEVFICGEVGNDTNAVIDGNTLTLTVEVGTECTGEEIIDVEGVRLSLVGSGRSSVTANVSSTGEVRLLGGANTTTVISSVVDELTDDGIDVDDTLTLIRHTGKVDEGDPTAFKLLIMENTVRSFAGTELKLDFSGIPDDITVTIDAWVVKASALKGGVNKDLLLVVPADAADGVVVDTKNDQLSINTPRMLTAEITAEDNEASVLTGQFEIDEDLDDSFTGGMLTNERDVVIVLGTISGATNKDVLPLDLNIEVTVDVGPIGVAIHKGTAPEITPRFASDKSTPVTVIESTSAQSMFLVPYTVTEAGLGGYDTGFSIANTTSGKTAHTGSVTFSFPGDATLESFESGMVGPGQNLTMLLSEIIGSTVSYTGQVKITANFTDAEGIAFVSDFMRFTSSTPLIKEIKK